MNGQLTIPKRIIQTGKTRDLTLLEQAAVANLTLLNPGFEYSYFDDAAIQVFLEREFPHYRAVFAGFRYNIQRIDFFRYLAVYRLGGFYFDLDVFLSRGIEELTSSRCVFPFEELTLSSHLRDQHQMDWEIGNYAFGAIAGHPYLGAVIENCVRAQKEPQWVAPMLQSIPAPFREGFHVLNSTGPGMLTRTMVENPEAAKDMHVLFPKDVCDERTWHKFGHYGVHLMAASWRPRGSYLKRRLALLWESRTRRRLLQESLKRGQQRALRSPLAAAL
jgi:inositol phosphorylceramide mannosyltransferase catalytic subunit